MERRARAIGPRLQSFTRSGTLRVGVHGAAIAVALGCVASCGADTASSNNPAATTAPAVTAPSTQSTSSNVAPASPSTSNTPAPTATSPTTPGTPATTTPDNANTSPAADSEPGGDTTEEGPTGGTSSPEVTTSEGDVSSTGPRGSDDQETGDQGTPSTSAGCGKTPTLTSGSATIDVDGAAREYILNLPSDYDPSKPYKLIFGLHWRGGQASDVATGGTVGLGNYYGLEDLADGSAIFVAPNGLDNGWANTGGRDIAFMKAILAAFQADLCIDLDRIFSVGFSYGGMMSFAIACEMGDVFRAIAPLSGALYSGCGNGTAPIAMWGSHGTADDVVPIDDGRAGLQEVLDRNHCGTETTPTSPDNCVTYSGCDEGYPVTWCEFDGGHGPQRWQTQPLWEFFSQF